MKPKHRKETPPGKILLEEFIRPMGLSPAEFAHKSGIPHVMLRGIISGKRKITPRISRWLAVALHTTPEFWLGFGKVRKD